MAEASANLETRPAVPAGTVFASAAGITAAWFAADSMGLLAQPLRLALTYLALLLAVVAAWPRQPLRRWWIVACVVVACLPAVAEVSSLHELLVVTAVLGLLAAGAEGLQRAALGSCAYAALGLAVYRLACSSIPLVWTLADRFGSLLGRFAGWIAGQPLNIGATFAGLDFLVLMATLYAVWLVRTERPRLHRAILAACAIAVGHLLYLVVLAHALDLAAMLPTAAMPTFDHPYIPPDWRWSPAVAQLLPWNLPAAAAAIHVSIACIMMRWAPWNLMSTQEQTGSTPVSNRTYGNATHWRRWSFTLGPLALAVILPISSNLTLGKSDLSGKTVVANMHGRLDWQQPQYDQYGQQSAGMFGMLPSLVESLGGQLRLSPELSEQDLADADVLLLLHPVGPMPEPIRDRVWDYVRRGGSLLLVAEPYLQEGGFYSVSSEFLKPISMTVRRDVAISETGNWQQACQLMTHPATRGIDPRRGDYFTDAGCSIALGLAARPMVVGRWGWSDPGSTAVLTGNYRLEPGERLGDLVLAAEQRFGQGSVIVLGNDHSLTNEGSVRGYTLTGRLLAHLAYRRSSPMSLWRQLLTLLLCVGLLALVGWSAIPRQVTFSALLLAVSLCAVDSLSRHSTRVVPGGPVAATEGPGTRQNLAYIDASHLEAYSDSPWVFDGIDGLALTLMRSGYLTATLPELTSERLQRAAMLVSVAPSRSFTDAERKIVQQFVEDGGVFICTVGAEEAAASQSLLEQFDIRVPPSPVPTGGDWREPEPMGRKPSDYGLGDYKVGVRFYAAWPVESRDKNTEILVRAVDNRPVVVSRRIGSGRIVVIGDTGFAMNKNLEYISGDPFEGQYENAHFWRWLITRVTDQQEWVPPAPPPPPAEETPTDTAGQEAQP